MSVDGCVCVCSGYHRQVSRHSLSIVPLALTALFVISPVLHSLLPHAHMHGAHWDALHAALAGQYVEPDEHTDSDDDDRIMSAAVSVLPAGIIPWDYTSWLKSGKAKHRAFG